MAESIISSDRAEVLINRLISADYSSAGEVKIAIGKANSILRRMKPGRRKDRLGKSLQSLIMLKQAFE